MNSVCPGLVEAELASGLLNTEAVYQDYLNCMPIPRHGVVEDIAAAVAFLCDASRAGLPACLPVDGGHHLRRVMLNFRDNVFGEDATNPGSFL